MFDDATKAGFAGVGTATYEKNGGCVDNKATGGSFNIKLDYTADAGSGMRSTNFAMRTKKNKCDAHLSASYTLTESGTGKQISLHFPDVSLCLSS